MTISVFDLFTIGIGPSSSHSVGPMRAAKRFLNQVNTQHGIQQIGSITTRLYGSLALTGKGHGTDKAILLGLEGEQPETVDPEQVDARIAAIRQSGTIQLLGQYPVRFDEDHHLQFLRKETLPHHPNGLRFEAHGQASQLLLERDYYSIGGGFVIEGDQIEQDGTDSEPIQFPYPYKTGDDLKRLAEQSGLSISQMTLANETCWRSEDEIRQGLLQRWQVMQQCVARGCAQEGILPGGLKVQRRAAAIYRTLKERPENSLRDPLSVLDWVDLYALAVNEENAAGGRVVTAPTNGAAGIIPAVLHYYARFCPGADDDGVIRFLLTAGAIGILYKENASISGAEVGCQGEVGVACSMAAGALTEVLGGSVAQVENAAEIGMEHNLGLTCDPVGGLVQVPCIERNAMGAIKAINASRLALRGDGSHRVSLDKVIKTMRQTGMDMQSKYKETSRGGLAVNMIEC